MQNFYLTNSIKFSYINLYHTEVRDMGKETLDIVASITGAKNAEVFRDGTSVRSSDILSRRVLYCTVL